MLKVKGFLHTIGKYDAKYTRPYSGSDYLIVHIQEAWTISASHAQILSAFGRET